MLMSHDSGKKMSRIRNSVIPVLWVFLLLSCGQKETVSSDQEGRDVQRKTKGPLEAEAWVDAEEITLADTVDMHLKLKIEKEYTPVIKADVLLKNQSFLLRDVKEDESSDTEYFYHDAVYTCEPNFSGTLEIPGVTIEFTKEEDDQVYSLTLDPFKIKVTGLTEEQRKNLQIADIIPPREFPKQPLSWWLVTTAALVVLTVTAAGFIVRRKRILKLKSVPPSERALAKLRALGEKQYIEEGKYEEFYYEITMIIRVFISEQFGIHAPESTTEEFLADMEHNSDFPEEYKPRFREYLDHCDMVKYAAVTPGTEEIQNIFNITRDFILSAAETPAGE